MYDFNVPNMQDIRAYTFDLGRTTIEAGKTKVLTLGGDLTMTLRSAKDYYKLGDPIKAYYSVIDKYGHKLSFAEKFVVDTSTWVRTDLPWTLDTTISNSGGTLGTTSQETWDMGRDAGNLINYFAYVQGRTWSISTSSSSISKSGYYRLGLTWDPDAYQGDLSATTSLRFYP